MSQQPTVNESADNSTTERSPEVKKKKTFGQAFLNFLMMGGFIIVLVVVVALFIVLSMAFNCK